ncbi:hypothetical protein [Tropicimonas aquimaris]|uniref:Uncharacterized protein n=1 Tax=Tropicimonas aquimaris TaxID=914152 RepID=A0ABW3IJS8_9RHOB
MTPQAAQSQYGSGQGLPCGGGGRILVPYDIAGASHDLQIEWMAEGAQWAGGIVFDFIKPVVPFTQGSFSIEVRNDPAIA